MRSYTSVKCETTSHPSRASNRTPGRSIGYTVEPKISDSRMRDCCGGPKYVRSLSAPKIMIPSEVNILWIRILVIYFETDLLGQIRSDQLGRIHSDPDFWALTSILKSNKSSPISIAYSLYEMDRTSSSRTFCNITGFAVQLVRNYNTHLLNYHRPKFNPCPLATMVIW